MNKTAVVTGGSRGIGFAVAEKLLLSGYNCVVTARNKNEKWEYLSNQFGNRCIFETADISLKEDRDSLIRTLTRRYGAIDLLVNNAGVAPKERKDMLEITEQDFDYVMDINLKGTYFLTQAVTKIMKEGGKIVNIGSVSAETVSLNRAEYCISKAGISMLTKLFAVRLAEKHIAVFEIRPGVIDTDMTEPAKEKYLKLAQNGLIPIGRLGEPSDVAQIVLSMAGGAFDYATGSIIECGGGLHVKQL